MKSLNKVLENHIILISKVQIHNCKIELIIYVIGLILIKSGKLGLKIINHQNKNKPLPYSLFITLLSKIPIQKF